MGGPRPAVLRQWGVRAGAHSFFTRAGRSVIHRWAASILESTSDSVRAGPDLSRAGLRSSHSGASDISDPPGVLRISPPRRAGTCREGRIPGPRLRARRSAFRAAAADAAPEGAGGAESGLVRPDMRARGTLQVEQTSGGGQQVAPVGGARPPLRARHAPAAV